MNRLTRRLFIAGAAAAAGGGLMIASLPRLKRELRAWRAAKPLGETAWIQIQSDGTVLVFCNVTEMGQGAVSGLLQGLAEELDAEWASIRFEMAPVSAAYSAPWGYSTGGSRSLRRLLTTYRELGAAARQMLIAAAAARWNTDEKSCTARQGRIRHMATGREVSFGEVAIDAAELRPPRHVSLKPPADWKYLGHAMPRLDLRDKVDGRAIYGIDVALPGLLTATLMHAPAFGATLKSVDPAPAVAIPGVRHVVELPDAVAVVADGFWAAQRGLRALRPQWQGGEQFDTAQLALMLDELLVDSAQLTAASEQERALLEAADADLSQSSSVIDATYSVPLLAQAPLEPMNATARPRAGGGMELWVPTQAQSDAQMEVASALGLRTSDVTIHPTFVGGGFGRRLANDYAVQAALIAKQVAAPVKLIWSREEDIRRSTFRTMAKARLRAVLTPDGSPALLRIQVATLHSYRRIGGLDDMAYTLPRMALSYAGVDTAVPIGSWRSVDMSQNTFFLECFLDECATAVGQDPFRFRAAMLRAKPRAIAVLDALRELSGWDAPPAPGTARGMAFAEGFGSFAGHVVEVRAEGAAGFRVTRVCCVIDCGFAVNPASVTAQVQGGVLYGLSAALTQQIELHDGGVLQSGFGDYPVMRSGDVPEIEVRILSDAANAPGGVGEPPVPPVAPALANAVASLRGQRPRSLPLLQRGAA